MKNTNEIEKQLRRKANNYLEEKAQEIFNIYQEINKYVGTSQNFIDYITHYNQYKDARPEDKGNHTAYVEPHAMKKKYELELAMNYKDRLVAKYTKELLTKLDIFE